jgi:hypothetical protein
MGDWPLNVFDEEQAATELPTMRAMAAADIHNLVFQLGGDIRVIPATVKRARLINARTTTREGELDGSGRTPQTEPRR